MLDSITKVEKTMKVAAPLQFGHYQQFCNLSQAGNPPKRGRFVGGFHEVPKTDPRV